MNEAISQLQADGWITEKARKFRFQPQDFWNLWDIIAVRSKGSKGDSVFGGLEGSFIYIRFIQVSLKYMSQKVGFKDLAQVFPVIPHATKEYWHKKNGEFVKTLII